MAAKISNHSQTLTFISHPDHMQITLRTHTLSHTHTLGHLSLCGSVQHQSGCWYPSGEGESCEWQEHVNSLKNKTKTNNSQKGATRLTAKYSKWENTARREPHSTMTADSGPGESVNCSYSPLFFILHSPVQFRRRRKMMWGQRADYWGFLAWNV